MHTRFQTESITWREDRWLFRSVWVPAVIHACNVPLNATVTNITIKSSDYLLTFQYNGFLYQVSYCTLNEDNAFDLRDFLTEHGYIKITSLNQHVHDFTERIIPATCTQEGCRELLCTCGEYVVTDIIPATGHHFSEWVTERKPTATLEGLAVRHCLDCGFSESKPLPRKAPTYSYRQVTATVGAVLNGGYYYCLDGQYYAITAKTSTDTEGDWRSIVTYYANETVLGEQIIPFMSYDESCSLSPIYSLVED